MKTQSVSEKYRPGSRREQHRHLRLCLGPLRILIAELALPSELWLQESITRKNETKMKPIPASMFRFEIRAVLHER